jgi:CRP/FNR family transcriptional regulator, dissimilatory nitrate respiration regulator
MIKPAESSSEEDPEAGIRETLRSARLFSGLAQSEYADIASFSRFKTIPKGQYLFHMDQKSFGFFVVQSGAINLHRIDSKGREVVLCVFRGGDSLAEGTLTSLTAYPADARAMEPSRVLVIDRTGFLGFMRSHPDVSIRIMESMGLRLRVLVGQLEGRKSLESGTRLITWLLRYSRSVPPGCGRAVVLENPKRELAAEIGITPETLSRMLTRLADKGLIVVKGRSISIPDPTALSFARPSAREEGKPPDRNGVI